MFSPSHFFRHYAESRLLWNAETSRNEGVPEVFVSPDSLESTSLDSPKEEGEKRVNTAEKDVEQTKSVLTSTDEIVEITLGDSEKDQQVKAALQLPVLADRAKSAQEGLTKLQEKYRNIQRGKISRDTRNRVTKVLKEVGRTSSALKNFSALKQPLTERQQKSLERHIEDAEQHMDDGGIQSKETETLVSIVKDTPLKESISSERTETAETPNTKLWGAFQKLVDPSNTVRFGQMEKAFTFLPQDRAQAMLETYEDMTIEVEAVFENLLQKNAALLNTFNSEQFSKTLDVLSAGSPEERSKIYAEVNKTLSEDQQKAFQKIWSSKESAFVVDFFRKVDEKLKRNPKIKGNNRLVSKPLPAAGEQVQVATIESNTNSAEQEKGKFVDQLFALHAARAEKFEETLSQVESVKTEQLNIKRKFSLAQKTIDQGDMEELDSIVRNLDTVKNQFIQKESTCKLVAGNIMQMLHQSKEANSDILQIARTVFREYTRLSGELEDMNKNILSLKDDSHTICQRLEQKLQ